MDINLWKEYGITGLIMFAVVLLLFMVIKWTLATTKEILIQAAKEREAWMDAVNKQTKALDEHTIQAREFHLQVKDEHKKQIDNQDVVCRILIQVEQALGRINGYKQ